MLLAAGADAYAGRLLAPCGGFGVDAEEAKHRITNGIRHQHTKRQACKYGSHQQYRRIHQKTSPSADRIKVDSLAKAILDDSAETSTKNLGRLSA
jgi:hypothetical protein